MIVRPEQNRTAEQTAYLDQLTQSNETIAAVFKLAQDFGQLLVNALKGEQVLPSNVSTSPQW